LEREARRVAETAYWTARLQMTDPKKFPKRFEDFYGKPIKTQRKKTADEIFDILAAVIGAAGGEVNGG
jgi:hypothetical protein